ncbi:MAG: hypothetical protein QGG71_26320 [Pirellulaceae bacterium]|jgi:hypothetical protein|nr:hypothetical protein [Pirellulaceae bacterium]
MTKVEDDPKPAVERRNEKRVRYTAILGFKELKGQKIPPNPPKPNATGANLSLGGICFQSEKRPRCEFVILYLPDGARAVVRVADITQDGDSRKYTSHCEVMRWLPDGATTLESPNSEPEPVHEPVTHDVQ